MRFPGFAITEPTTVILATIQNAVDIAKIYVDMRNQKKKSQMNTSIYAIFDSLIQFDVPVTSVVAR